MGIQGNLDKLMKMQGLSAADLSDKSGVPASRISEIVTGKTKNPQLKTVQKLASGLGVPVDEITGGAEIIKEAGLPYQPAEKKLSPEKRFLWELVDKMTDEEAFELVLEYKQRIQGREHK